MGVGCSDTKDDLFILGDSFIYYQGEGGDENFPLLYIPEQLRKTVEAQRA